MMRRLVLAALAIVFAPRSAASGADPLAATGPPFAISRETTHITEPLTDEGWPDYAAAILRRQRAGVTRENNGVVLFWQALGPGAMQQDDFAVVCQELGAKEIESAICLTSLSSAETRLSLAVWRNQRDRKGPDAVVDPDSASIDEILDNATKRPWTPTQIPPLGAWVVRNNDALDLLVRAADKLHWYDPSPSLLTQPGDLLMAANLWGVQSLRTAGQALLARSMYELGAGDHAAAWRDCRAVWQLGNHALSQDWTLVGELMGIALHGVAHSATIAILAEADLPGPVATEILEYLSSNVRRADMAQMFEQGERWACLDAIARYYKDPYPLHELAGSEPFFGDEFFAPEFCAAEAALRTVNASFDELAAAVRFDDRNQRAVALDALDARLDGLREHAGRHYALALVSGTVRGRMLGEILTLLFIPSGHAACSAADRQQAIIDLSRMAAALAAFRSVHGEYPASLDELMPAVLSKLPADLYSGKPFVYHRRGYGYLLYSVFENGVDDGGTDISGEIVDGEWIGPDDEPADVEFPDEGDLVIRVPVPPLHVPAPPAGGAVERVDPAE